MKQQTRLRQGWLCAIAAAGILIPSCSSPTPPATSSATEPAAIGNIVRLDPAFDALVPANARIEKVAGGFTFIEGPVWRPSGAVWFSDVVGNVIRQWTPANR